MKFKIGDEVRLRYVPSLPDGIIIHADGYRSYVVKHYGGPPTIENEDALELVPEKEVAYESSIMWA